MFNFILFAGFLAFVAKLGCCLQIVTEERKHPESKGGSMSSSKILKPYEGAVEDRFNVFIYGASGIGKTALALSSRNPVLFDFGENKEQADIFHSLYHKISTYQNLLNFLYSQELNQFSSVIFDGIGGLVDLAFSTRPRGSETANGYVLWELASRLEKLDKNFIFIAEAKEDKRIGGNFKKFYPVLGKYDAGQCHLR